MTPQKAMNILIKELRKIKKKGGSPFDFIQNENEILDNNYDISLTALGFDGLHVEKDFDDALQNLYDNI